jgi:hypothetical protein
VFIEVGCPFWVRASPFNQLAYLNEWAPSWRIMVFADQIIRQGQLASDKTLSFNLGETYGFGPKPNVFFFHEAVGFIGTFMVKATLIRFWSVPIVNEFSGLCRGRCLRQ